MMARGFIPARGGAFIGTALGAALAGVTIGLAVPADAAPAGPDSAQETSSDQELQGSIVVVDRLDIAPLNRSRVSGVPLGLEPRLLDDSFVFAEVG